MKKVQDWNNEDKILLKNKILSIVKNQFSNDIKEIYVVGSRIRDDYNSNSDLDIIVYVENFNNKYTINEYFNINNKKIDLSICIKDSKYITLSEKSKYRYDLPNYSLKTNKYYKGNINHVIHSKKLRNFIKENYSNIGFLNLDWDKFNKENNHLL